MVGNRSLSGLVAALILVVSVAAAMAQGLPGASSLPGAGTILAPSVERGPGWYTDRGIRKFVNSFCSYEFPASTGQDPLSRLEFPVDQWFTGGQSGYVYSTLTFRVDSWAMLNRESTLKFQDSDWTFPADPNQKTVFSESNCRMLEGYLLDISADWAVLPGVLAGVRPVGGFRWHTFHFLTHDGYQGSIDPNAPSSPLPGDGIDGRFTFRDWWYLGARACCNWGPFMCTLEGDYGWLRADMVDRHLLQGDTRTELHGRGHAWRLSAGMAVSVRNSLTMRLEGDFTRISVIDTATQQWDESGSFPGSGHGGKIWSDQQSVAASVELRF